MGQQGQERTDFARALAPVTPADFFAEYFERRHLVVQRDAPEYYADLLTVADIDRVLSTQMIPEGDIQMVRKGQPVEDWLTPTGFADPVRVVQEFADGATLVLPALHKRLPQLAAWCRSLETVFSCDLQTNIYFTPEGSQGFKTHYDSHDVVVLQCAGSKLWRIYESPLELPLRSQAFTPEGFTPGKVIDEFVLHAGDMAYVPRGVVHDAQATDELSLHITTGLLATRWADALVEAVAELARRDAALRRALPPGHANPGFAREGAVAEMRALLARLVEGADAEAVLEAYASDFRRARVPMVPGQLVQMAHAEGVAPGTPLRRRPDLIHAITEAGEEVVLSVYGGDIRFPRHAAGALRDALAREGFTVGDLAGDLDAEGQAVLARRLIREGVLIRVG